jgi:membrane protein
MDVKSAFGLVKESFKEWKEDGALDLGAALAYYTIFSIAPMLLVVVAVAGWVWGREAVQGQLVGQMQGLLGTQGAEAIQGMIANAGKQGSSGLVATIVGLATTLFGATGVFVQLQNALNRIWDVEPKPGGGVWGFVKNRLLSFGMLLGIGFLLLVSLVLSAAMGSIDRWAEGLGGAGQVLARILSFGVSFAVITLLFAMIYKFLPDVKIAWRDVVIGAAVTALLFTIGKLLIGLYLSKSSVASGYGAAGSLVVLLLWTYYSAQIVFLGAEFTQVYASRYGSRIEPAENAVPVVERKEVASKNDWPPAKRGEKGEEGENKNGAPERPERRKTEDRRKAGRS